MSTLDNPNSYVSIPAQDTALRYGLIGGLISIVLALLSFVFGLSNPSNMMSMMVIGLLSLVITIVILVMAARDHRKKQGGFMKFGKAFMVAFITAVIMGLLGGIFNYVYTNFIDPNYMADMMEGFEQMYANMGMNEEQIEMAMEQAQKQMTPTKQLMNSILYPIIWGAVIALIIGAVMKKNPPEDMIEA